MELTQEQQDMILKAIAENEIIVHDILEYTEFCERTANDYLRIVLNSNGIASLVAGLEGEAKVREIVAKAYKDPKKDEQREVDE